MKKANYLLLMNLFLLNSCNSKTFSCPEIFNECHNKVYRLEATSITGKSMIGSAVGIDDKGTLITNAHLLYYLSNNGIKKFEEIYVFDENNEKVLIDNVCYDEIQDIGIINFDFSKKENFNWDYFNFNDEIEISNGEKVFAIGNSLNKGIGISEGNVHINNVEVKYGSDIRNVIQCNLNIFDGNSGGALVNSHGELIGITSFKIRDDSNNVIENMSYSIPITTYKRLIYND